MSVSSAAPVPPTLLSSKSSNAIIIRRVQEKNPLLKHIKNVPWEFGEILPDFLVGQTTCALFLSIRYHIEKPNYLHERVRELTGKYRLRILLVLVDRTDQDILGGLAKFCVTYNLCLLLSWSLAEAARYLETFKAYEHKTPEQLQERTAKDYMSQLTTVLTSIRSVNRSDVVTLASTFGCLQDIARASLDDVRLCPGFGDRKAERLFAILDEPFVRKRAK